MRRLAITLVLTGLALSLADRVGAQEAPGVEVAKPGFGENTNGIFTVENVFGFSETTISQHEAGRDVSASVDDKGFFPGLLGPRLGFFGASGHVTYGAVVSAWWAKPVGQGSDNSSSVFATTIGPRIGYAGAVPKQPTLGYWLRTGPTFIYAHTERTSGTGTTNTSNAGYFDWSFEAYGVIHPVDHFGIFIGPALDVALFGKDSGEDQKWGIISLGIGLLADW